MKALLSFLLFIIAFVGNCQYIASSMIMMCPNTTFTKGTQVYQIGISLSDTTIKKLYFQVLSSSGPGQDNEGLAFCFGHPKLLEKGIPDSTGILYIYNPEPILKRGSGTVWNLLVVAYDARLNAKGLHDIVYRGWEELYFPKMPDYKPNPPNHDYDLGTEAPKQKVISNKK